MSNYGVRVLLESALGIGLVVENHGKYTLTRTGYFILHDPLTKVNMDFIHDVCYKGLFALDKSIETGKPEGLKEFGDWSTIYEGLSQLPAHVQKSWFAFDHFFSDNAFPSVIKHVYDSGIKKVLDIGGNTGKWAIASVSHDPDIHITIMDLPGQLNVAKKKIAELGLTERVSFYQSNILDEQQPFPTGFDAIWMSQFLDCFSETEIISILKRCANALMTMAICLYWKRSGIHSGLKPRPLPAANLHLFHCLANGNSQMYDSRVFKQCIYDAGPEIVEQTDGIGLSHSLLKCRKRGSKCGNVRNVRNVVMW